MANLLLYVMESCYPANIYLILYIMLLIFSCFLMRMIITLALSFKTTGTGVDVGIDQHIHCFQENIL